MASTQKALRPVHTPNEKVTQLTHELHAARQKLVAVEATLAEEQAAVNAFRLHCRLQIGGLVDTLLDLRSEKQTYLIQLQLLMQELGIAAESDEQKEKSEKENAQAESDPELFDLDGLVAETAANQRDRDAEKRLYRELARRFHPDLAANSMEQAYRTTIMSAVNIAYQQRDVQTLRDLAGEVDPRLLADIENSETSQIRTLRKQLLGCQRRLRKVTQQLAALRKENITRLWQQSQLLEIEGNKNWWVGVQQQLVRETKRLRVEVTDLQSQIELLTEQKVNSESSV